MLPVSFFSVPHEATCRRDDAAQAYRDLEHGTVRGRAVVVPHDSCQP